MTRNQNEPYIYKGKDKMEMIVPYLTRLIVGTLICFLLI